MEQIGKEVKVDWDKEIGIKLTLWELQMIRDAFGATSHDIRKGSFVRNSTNVVSNPYETYRGHNLYLELEKVLKENGGVIHNEFIRN